MINKQIPIFFAIDNNYAKYCACAIKSIIMNSSKQYDYKLIVIHNDLNEENQKRLKALEESHFEIMFKEMNSGLEAITDREENRLRCENFTLTIYLRIFIADMFPEFDKAIYIDSDTVVPGDISKLFEFDLKGKIIGGCIDASIQEVPDFTNYIQNAVGLNPKEYINSGVLLMDLKKLRDVHFADQFLHLLTTYQFDSVAPDQDYINAMLNGNILYLDSTWDAMPNNNHDPLPNPQLIHYNLFEKPWCYDGIQYGDEFWKYARLSGYYDDILRFKNSFSEADTKAERETLNYMLEKARNIPNNNITMRIIHEKNNDIRIKNA